MAVCSRVEALRQSKGLLLIAACRLHALTTNFDSA